MHGTVFRDLAPGDAGWIVMRHGALYARDEGYGPAFEALVADVMAGFLRTRGPLERAWIAVDAAGKRQGCILCTRPEPTAARLRLFLVEPERRGTGLGRALLGQAVAQARGTGAARLLVSTHASHEAAGRLYARSGFKLLAENPVIAFGHATREQDWALDL